MIKAPSVYAKMIAAILGISVERARLVEGYLRLQYSTLGNLSREDIAREYGAGGISAAIDSDPTAAESLAVSYGL